MQYTVTKQDKGKVEIKVDLPKAAFSESYGQVLDKMSADVNVAGFRPGKVPANVAEQHIGLTKLLNETASFLVSKHLADIFAKENLTPIANPKIAVDSLAKDEPFSFVATLYTKPKVTLGDWKSIKVETVNAKEVTEDDVDKSIQNIYEAWKKQKDSKKEQGISDESKEETSSKFIYDAQGEKRYIKDEKVETVQKDEKADEIDDDFAKAIGAENLAHLRELVKKDLETLVADSVEAKAEENIFEKMLEVGEVEVPDILVEDELNRILVRLNSQLEKQGQKLDDYLAEQKLTLEQLKGKWMPQAEKNVKVTLIMDQIGQDEKILVGREEIDEALKGVNQEKVDPSQKADLERYLAVSIFQAKTLALVKKTITASSK